MHPQHYVSQQLKHEDKQKKEYSLAIIQPLTLYTTTMAAWVMFWMTLFIVRKLQWTHKIQVTRQNLQVQGFWFTLMILQTLRFLSWSLSASLRLNCIKVYNLICSASFYSPFTLQWCSWHHHHCIFGQVYIIMQRISSIHGGEKKNWLISTMHTECFFSPPHVIQN